MMEIKKFVIDTSVLENKILPGFWYRNTPMRETYIDHTLPKGSLRVDNQTNHVGALNMIREFRKAGLDDAYIATQIQVLTDADWRCLSEVDIKLTENGTE